MDKKSRLQIARSLLTAAAALEAAGEPGPKVTIYAKDSGFIGIKKVEGFLTKVEDHAIQFMPRRGRRERVLMTFYVSWILVVEGWNKPNPDDPFHAPEQSDTGVTVRKGKYRGQDPRWTGDFMEGPGKGLKPFVLYEDNRFKINKFSGGNEMTAKFTHPSKDFSVFDRMRDTARTLSAQGALPPKAADLVREAAKRMNRGDAGRAIALAREALDAMESG